MEDPRFKLTVRELVDLSRKGFDVRWLFGPYIDGVEVTQAIQYYKADQHLTDTKDRGLDNSVQLVAFKPAWVRVYLRSLFFQIENVTGELVISRRVGRYLGTLQTVATLPPQSPGSATAAPFADYATERSSLGATLNFIIPAAEMFGLLKLKVRIWPQGSTDPADVFDLDLGVTLLQTLRLRGIFINYNGLNAAGTANLNLAAPTLADLQNTAAWTLTVDPVQSVGSFASAGTLTWTTPLTGVATVPGGCSTQWLQLNAAVAQVKANDGNRNDVIYYGLLPNGIPIANVGGCESSGVSTGPNGAQVTMAHEVGHAVGLGHGPCGTTSGDTNYPAYEPYDSETNKMSRIGEYGLNINSGTIITPQNNDDYMSYCNQSWISLYHHNRLINVAKFTPQTVGGLEIEIPVLVDPWLWPWEYIPDPAPIERNGWDWKLQRAEPLISIIGLVNENQEVEVTSVMRVTALRQAENSRQSRFIAELIGRENKTIASAPLMQLVSQGVCNCHKKCDENHPECESKGPFIFQALLSDIEDGETLRILSGSQQAETTQELWSRRAPEQKPNISGFEIYLREGLGYAQWQVGDTYGETLEFSLQFSKDDGKSWNGLTVGIQDSEYCFDLSALPSGEVVFALLAHDGFHTTKVTSNVVELPSRAPIISIMHPVNGSIFEEGQSIRFWGMVSTATAQRIEQEACHWLLDGHEIMSGSDGWISAPVEGEHQCAFIVDDEGGRAEAVVSFTTSSAQRA